MHRYFVQIYKKIVVIYGQPIGKSLLYIIYYVQQNSAKHTYVVAF